jgi:glutaredoxin
LYFYTTDENCSDCKKQGIVLSTLRENYPTLRVYSFDYSTDLSAVKAMLQIYKIEDTKLPALVLDDEVMTGFRTIEELEGKIKISFGLEEKKPEGKETKDVKEVKDTKTVKEVKVKK